MYQNSQANQPPNGLELHCRLCGSGSFIKYFEVEKTSMRGGVFTLCRDCKAWSFRSSLSAQAYGKDYYGLGNSKIGGIALNIRILSSEGRARFLRQLITEGECLDIGCGDGEFLWAMHRLGWSVKGTELPGPAFDRAYSRFPGRIICTERFESVGRPASFKLITMWQVFEHLDNPSKVLQECAKLLVAGGILAIGVPNPSSWQAIWGGRHWLHLDPPRHLHLQSLETLIDYAEKLGFTLVAIRHPWMEFGPIGWIQTMMNKLGFPRDYFFERMKDRWIGVPILVRLGHMMTAALLAIPATILAILERMCKKSATYEVYFRS